MGYRVVLWFFVVSFHFQGTSALVLDAKGRFVVPVRHREVLQTLAAGQLTLTRHPQGCLMVCPRPVWERFRELVSPELRAAAGVTRDVLLLQPLPDVLRNFTF